MQVLPPGSTGGPSRLFILRPVATTLLMAAILLAGIIGYRFLPVAALPEVDYPTIQVVTLYPGASPDVMTSAVTAPLERQFGQMSGLKQMSSQSSGGASVVTLQFQLTLPLDVAEQEVQAAINAATNLLPSDLPNPPIYSKVNPADPPIMTLAVTSNAMPMTQVEDMVETRVAQKISQVSGVGLVTLAGGQRPAVRVKLNAQAIAALGLTSETVRTAITGANVNSAKGSLDGPERAVTLSANDQMQSADEYRRLIIAYQNGAPVRLGDVATVEQGAENSWLGAQRRGRNRLYHYFPHLFPDCSTDPVALYGRYCWSTVPRICGDVGGSDFNFRRRLFDAHAHDVRTYAQPAVSA